MSSSGVLADPVTEAVDQLIAACDAGLERLQRAEMTRVAEKLQAAARKLNFLQMRLVRVMDDSKAVTEAGAPSVKEFLQSRLRLSPSEAGARVRAAKALCEGQAITGAPIPAPLPVVAAAAQAGEVGAAHVDVIERTMHDLPEKLDPDVRDSVEQDLVDNARLFNPKDLRRIARRILLHLDPDKPDRDDNDRRRALSFHDDLPGLVAIRGQCTAEAVAVIQAALDPLAKPKPEIDGIKDPRSRPQRVMDALQELAGHSLKSGHVTITGTIEDMKAGSIDLPWVGPVLVNSADWLLRDAAITFIETDENGVPTRMSKPQRTVKGWLRRSVFARDGGCAFPGCDRPVGWSDIHDVVPWEQRKEHQLDNLVTLCGYHHRLVHARKWQIDFIDRIPHFRPPKWIDPDQKPIRNHLHDTARFQPLRT